MGMICISPISYFHFIEFDITIIIEVKLIKLYNKLRIKLFLL
jgi:hypothetical protein